MIKKTLQLLSQYWWGLIVAYFSVSVTIFALIWTIAEPLGIPEVFDFPPSFMRSRAFYHIFLALFISAIVTLVLELYVRRTGWPTSHDPTKPVRENLSHQDVHKGLLILVEDAKAFQPDFIYGINRGGAIVGGYIAKMLDIPGIYLLTVNSDLPSDQRVIEHRDDGLQIHGRVLLVDDAKRKGEHMREAVDYLSRQYSGITLRRQVLLEMSVPHYGPERTKFRSIPVERTAFFTNDISVRLPWDP